MKRNARELKERGREGRVCLVTEKPPEIVILTLMHYSQITILNLGIHHISSPPQSDALIMRSCSNALNEPSDSQVDSRHVDVRFKMIQIGSH